MQENVLRALVDDVRAGRTGAARFRRAPGRRSASPRRSRRCCLPRPASRRRSRRRLQADPARRRRGAEAAVLARADAAEPALRHRRQGSGRRRPLLRAARALRRRRQARPGARRRDPEPRQRRHRRRRALDDVEAQEGRAAGTTGARSRPTTSSSTAPTRPIPRPRRRRVGAYEGIAGVDADRRRHRALRLPASRRRSGRARATVAARSRSICSSAYARRASSRDAPANLRPVGTGPYRFVDFKPGDLLRGEINRDYHAPNRPHFDSVELKGGGDATSAARAVLQTGEYDFAWNLQVEDDVLTRMEASRKGRVVACPSGDVEMIQFNHADPCDRGRRRARRARSRATRSSATARCARR